MPKFDIPVDVSLQGLFNLPPCDTINIPFPKPMKIQLPTGGSISAISDISKGIPTDCAMTFSLMVQIAPLLASTECLMKVLKLLKPLIDVVKGLPVPPVKAIQEFAKAAADLAPCLLAPTPLNIIPFLRDILCMIIKMLKCFIGQMKSLIGIMSGIKLQLQLADGNDELTQSLQCAQENAARQAQHLTASVEPVGVILDLAGALFDIAGVPGVKLPSLASPDDLKSMTEIVKQMSTFVATLQTVADVLGGCD